MPNAGIHDARSTSWNSADEASNASQIASVTANATSEKASASQRIRPSRRPSALPMSSRMTAPASGSTHDSVSSGIRVCHLQR